MGIIKKQGMQATTYSYIGVLVGFITNALLMPTWLTVEQVGLLSFLNSITNIIAGLFGLGLSLIILNIFPRYKDKSLNGLFTFVQIMTVFGIVLSLLTYFGLYDFLLSDKNEASAYRLFNLGFVVICSFRIIFRNNDSLIRMMKNTVFGTILERLVVKIVVLAALIYYYLVSEGSFSIIFYAFIVALSIPGIMSQLYMWNKGMKLTSFKTMLQELLPVKNHVFSLGFFGILNALGAQIILEVDRVMVSNLIGLDGTAIYSTAFLFGAFISIPAYGIKRISSVLISTAWSEKDMATISTIYKKSSTNLAAVGFYLLLGVWLNLGYVFTFLPEEYASGKYVMLFIGFSQLVDMTFGVNNEILATSKLYRYSTYFTGLLIIMVIGLNVLFIPLYGINGAAVASLIALVSVNIFRFTFLYKNYDLQPLSWQVAVTWLVGSLFFALPLVLVEHDNVFANMFIVSSILTVGYWSILYMLKISPDINDLINQYLSRIFSFRRR